MMKNSAPVSTSNWERVGNLLAIAQRKKKLSLAQRAELRTTVAQALCEQRVCLAYQPVVSTHPGYPVSFYEALLRFRDHNGELVLPGKYLQAVEGTELGLQLDLEVLDQAIKTLMENPDMRLAINIAPSATSSLEWMSRLQRAASKAPDIAYRLIVEITESTSLLAQKSAGHFLKNLRNMGVSVALDDFGAGTTSFRYFREFKFDIVKIDGSFCRGLGSSGDNRVLVKALVDIAAHFEMLIVAEHVETKEDAAVASALGVDCLQGYLTGRPNVDLVRNWTQSA